MQIRQAAGTILERGVNFIQFRLMPAPPVRRRGVPDVGDRISTSSWRRWHSPTHRRQLAFGAGIPDDRRGVVRKHARHRRQVADVTVDHPEQREDGGLVGGDAAEIAHVGRVQQKNRRDLTLSICRPAGPLMIFRPRRLVATRRLPSTLPNRPLHVCCGQQRAF
jgi:hypothetical protein